MLRKLGIAFVVLLVLLIAAGLGGYYWAKSSAWSKIASLAAEKGALLEKPEWSFSWRGGRHFVIDITNLKGQLQAPLPIEGHFALPQLHLDVSLSEDNHTVTLHDLKIQQLTGQFVMTSKAEVPLTEGPGIAIPDLEVPVFERPSLPVDLVLKSFQISGKDIDFTLRTEGPPALQKNLKVQMQGLTISGQGQLIQDKTALQASIELNPSEIEQDTATQLAKMSLTHLKLNVTQGAEVTTPYSLALKTEGSLTWAKMSLEKKEVKGLKLADQGGRFEFQAEGRHLDLKLQGQKMSANSLKKPADWSLTFQPLHQDQDSGDYQFEFVLPELLNLQSQMTLPRRVDTSHLVGHWQGRIRFLPEVAGLFMEVADLPWKKQVEGPFDVTLKPDGGIVVDTAMKSEGFDFDLNGSFHPQKGEAVASGALHLNLRPGDIKMAGLSPQGRMHMPFKLLLRPRQKFFFDSELQFQGFTLQSKDMKAENLEGVLPIKQSWAYEEGHWQLSPRLTPNAFGRADFESFQPLEGNPNTLRLTRLEFQKKTYGPISFDMKFEQNLLQSGAWSAQVGQGQLEGALQADVSLDNPRLGLLMRAFEVKLDELLPETMLRTQHRSEKGLTYRLGMDWDLGKATAVGRLDWSDIDSPQVMQILDYLDPQFENATFNQARMILAQAYPTRLQVEMRGPVADVRISTNLVTLPDVRNVAISPYLVKANESLYASELYRTLRKKGAAQPKTKESSRVSP